MPQTRAFAADRTALLRFLPTLAGLAVFGALVALHGAAPAAYTQVVRAIGVVPWRTPFVDAEFIFAVKQCWRQGVDVYRTLPCHVVPNTPMPYSPLWPRLLPGDKSDTLAVGMATDLLFLLSLSALPAPRSAREAAVMTLAAVSTTTVFALERNNVDVWIFVAVVAATLLLIRGGLWRYAAYAAYAFLGLLKY